MTTETKYNWQDANKQYLVTAIAALKGEFLFHKKNQGTKKQFNLSSTIQKKLDTLRNEMKNPPALLLLAELFRLTSFEQKIVLMCAAVELDSDFAVLFSAKDDLQQQTSPSFGLALSVIEDAHWSALSPEAALRYWKLVEVAESSAITKSPLTINEQILHYITGIQHLDIALEGIVEPYTNNTSLVDSHQQIADKIISLISPGNETGNLPVISLDGENYTDKPAIAARVCEQLNIRLYQLPASAIPEHLKELDHLARAWNRQSVLSSSALYLDLLETGGTNSTLHHSVVMFCNKIQGLLFLDTRRKSPKISRSMVSFEVKKPLDEEQVSIWENELNSQSKKMNGAFQNIVSQFNMTAESIRKTSSEIVAQTSVEKDRKNGSFEHNIWQACCKNTRSGLDELAQRIQPMAFWDDLVLPENQQKTLHEIAMHVRQKSKVYNDWGFASKTSRGLGISALFTGESGTGKTMASEVLANELQLDLYRIDLSQVVNKYIGETEKNLKKIFDAADKGGAILLFDEADALFGKRSDVKDSHDRYANIEVSYLLQRMEAYRGLAILTTNLKTSLDKAFLRRIRFVVQFPFPDTIQRSEIWKRVFPSKLLPIISI